MKILVLNSLSIANALGGAERSTHITCKAFVDRGHDVTLLAFSRDKLKNRDIDGVKVKLYKLYNFYWPFTTTSQSLFKKISFHILDIFNPFSTFTFIKNVLHEKPDILWTNMIKGWSAGPWLIAKLLRIPIVNTVREFDLIYRGDDLMKDPQKPKKIPILGSIKKIYSLLPDAVVGISNDILNRYLEENYFSGALPYVINNPVEFNKEKRSKVEPLKYPIKIGWLGRFSGEKGCDIYLDCVEKMANDRKYEFHIAGQGNLEITDRIVNMQKEGSIKYWGYCDSSDFFSKMDISVVSSLAPEPFGRVVIEAYQQYCFVISSDRGGLPEVNTNPSCGHIYDASVDELKNSLIKSENLLKNRSTEEFDKETNKYRSQKIAQEYLNIFNHFIKA